MVLCGLLSWLTRSSGAYLGRYRKQGVAPKYKSATCEVWCAIDLFDADKAEVALKVMTRVEHLKAEVEARFNQGLGLDADSVLDFRCTHLPCGPSAEYPQHIWRVHCWFDIMNSKLASGRRRGLWD